MKEVDFCFQLLLDHGIQPIIIPDSDGYSLTNHSDKFIVCHDAALDFGFRLAIYESAILNVATPCGPMMPIILDKRSKGYMIKTFLKIHLLINLAMALQYTKRNFVLARSRPLIHSSVYMNWNPDFSSDLLQYMESFICSNRSV